MGKVKSYYSENYNEIPEMNDIKTVDISTLKDVLLKITLIECELDDNNIDEAKNELYCLKDDIERLILDTK